MNPTAMRVVTCLNDDMASMIIDECYKGIVTPVHIVKAYFEAFMDALRIADPMQTSKFFDKSKT